MASINKAMRGHDVPSRRWHVPGNSLRCVPVEVMPIILFESQFVDPRMLWVECEFSFRVQFEVTEDPVNLLQMTLTRHGHVGGHQRSLK